MTAGGSDHVPRPGDLMDGSPDRGMLSIQGCVPRSFAHSARQRAHTLDAAMSVKLRLTDPRVGSNLVDFVERNGLRAILDGNQVVIDSRHQSADRQLVEVSLLVRIWQIVNPEHRVEIESA